MKKLQLLKQISIVLLLMFSVSCISTKPANTLAKAEKKIGLYNEGIENQIKQYPELVKDAFTKIEYDTVFIYADSAKLKILYQNIDYLDSLNKVTNKNYEEQLSYLDSLQKIDYTKYDTTGKLKLTVNSLTSQLRKLLKENKELAIKYNEEITKKTVGEYSDSTFIVNYLFEKGNLTLNIKTKPSYKVVPVSYTTNKIKATTRFWQDYRFYGFLLVLLNLFYFFGAEIQKLIQKIINGILTIIRKLLIKV